MGCAHSIAATRAKARGCSHGFGDDGGLNLLGRSRRIVYRSAEVANPVRFAVPDLAPPLEELARQGSRLHHEQLHRPEDLSVEMEKLVNGVVDEIVEPEVMRGVSLPAFRAVLPLQRRAAVEA